jgi:hypothetical protein
MSQMNPDQALFILRGCRVRRLGVTQLTKAGPASCELTPASEKCWLACFYETILADRFP